MQPCPEEAILSALITTHRGAVIMTDPRSVLQVFSKGDSSTGRATVSKTVGWGFEPLSPCPVHGSVAQRQLLLAVNQTAKKPTGVRVPPGPLSRCTTGSSAAWQRVCFGGRRSPVQIRPSRPLRNTLRL